MNIAKLFDKIFKTGPRCKIEEARDMMSTLIRQGRQEEAIRNFENALAKAENKNV